VGNVIPRKGLHGLLAALARLPRATWRLDVVGCLAADPAYTRSLRARIAAAGLAANVRLLGSQSDGALVGRLAQSDVLAVPSAYEGYGIVYAEGMRFGLPAIGSTRGGAQEIISAGRDGLLVAPDDIPGLAAGLRLLADDRERLLAMSLAARARAAQHPTWSECVARIAGFVQQVARDYHRRAEGVWSPRPSTTSRAIWPPSGASTTRR
jgi:glycosyltransferase involved in cell wall biosynthesis